MRLKIYYYLKINLVPIDEDEIRLLYLPRRSWKPFAGGIIQVKLFSVPLAEAKDYHYEAMSYTWRETSLQRSIAIWGRRHDISQSLHQLLHARRSFIHDRFLWIDQICINQENGEEVQSQIKKMRDIYIDAYRVVAWLDDNFDASMAARTIAEISNKFQL
ncbi:heterokaryon incompatibility protein-domain-containing protein [Fusarium redolens]|uniref:Heterokaryon incompatibility protein-domain-containing protein n=1 Tax=Fusarium redolens TaxID=48865 RepID=A0A9P9JQP7_FUSRE|nr:heterokaryon incompatibility protein-domain-containing protein [Fusarium redolens]KAH7216868.1 heterokaryon incompatibility protein-domain-containing protein [Fusarium redolens]